MVRTLAGDGLLRTCWGSKDSATGLIFGQKQRQFSFWVSIFVSRAHFNGHLHPVLDADVVLFGRFRPSSKADTHYLLFCALEESDSDSVDRSAANLHIFSGYDCLKNALLAQSGMALKLRKWCTLCTLCTLQ